MLGAITTLERKKERKRERVGDKERHTQKDRPTDRYRDIARARVSQINKPTYKKKTVKETKLIDRQANTQKRPKDIDKLAKRGQES